MKPRLVIKPGLNLSSPVRTRNRIASKPPPKVVDPLANNPRAVTEQLPENLTFIRRPPPSAPTPHSLTTNPSSPLLQKPASHAPAKKINEASLPPLLKQEKVAPPRMSDSAMATLRRLRLSDPEKWSASKLAKQFNCTPAFVRAIAGLPKEAKIAKIQAMEAEHAEVREGWGQKKTLDRLIRQKRREFW